MPLEIKEFHLTRQGIYSVLGDLETELMEFIWDSTKELTNRELLEMLNKKRSKLLEVSTINITMTRLYKKRLVDRRLESIRGGHHYLYLATMTKQAFICKISQYIIKHLQNSFGDNILKNYVNTDLLLSSEEG